jgi:hypothetical protein
MRTRSGSLMRLSQMVRTELLLGPIHHITTVEYVGFDGYKWDFCPRVYLLLQPIWHMVCPRISSGLHKGPSPRLSPANPGRHPECSRVARCGAIYPRALPHPWAGFFAQEQRLWGRGGQNRLPKPKNLFTCQLKIYLITFSIAERLNRAARHV